MCVLLFLCVAVPGIWILELDRLDRYNAALSGNTTWESEAESLSKISGVSWSVGGHIKRLKIMRG